VRGCLKTFNEKGVSEYVVWKKDPCVTYGRHHLFGIFPAGGPGREPGFREGYMPGFSRHPDEGSLVLVYGWIDGYLSAKSGNTNVDLGAFESNVTELAKACEQNPKANLLKTVQGQ
jgi:hypothetical protein